MSETETGETQPIDEGRGYSSGMAYNSVNPGCIFLIDTILLFDLFQLIGTPVHYSQFHRLNRGYTISRKNCFIAQ